jgi:hypothetical protein
MLMKDVPLRSLIQPISLLELSKHQVKPDVPSADDTTVIVSSSVDESTPMECVQHLYVVHDARVAAPDRSVELDSEKTADLRKGLNLVVRHGNAENPKIEPPRLAELAACLFVPRTEGEVLLGDLEEGYRRRRARFGPRVAAIWYWWQVGSLIGLWLRNVLVWSAGIKRAVDWISKLGGS